MHRHLQYVFNLSIEKNIALGCSRLSYTSHFSCVSSVVAFVMYSVNHLFYLWTFFFISFISLLLIFLPPFTLNFSTVHPFHIKIDKISFQLLSAVPLLFYGSLLMTLPASFQCYVFSVLHPFKTDFQNFLVNTLLCLLHWTANTDHSQDTSSWRYHIFTT